MGQAVDNFLKFQARHGPPLMGLGPTRHAIYSNPWARPGPCPPLILSNTYAQKYLACIKKTSMMISES